MNFIECYDEETKEKLLSYGFKFISDESIGDNKVFLFQNNLKKINFDKSMKINVTNRMVF